MRSRIATSIDSKSLISHVCEFVAGVTKGRGTIKMFDKGTPEDVSEQHGDKLQAMRGR